MVDGKTITAIILMAGNSSRYGKNKNKNLEILNGKTVLLYSLNEFEKNSYVDDIIIAAKNSELETVNNIINKHTFNKNIKVIVGGHTRKESVYNCIKQSNSEVVIIHDGARPMIKQEYINKCINSIKEFKGVTIGVKSKDTIKIADDNGVVINTTKRSNTWIIQTPQCFIRDILLQVHNKYDSEDITDDCMLLEKEGYKVKVIEGDYTNIKITTYEDMKTIQGFLENN